MIEIRTAPSINGGDIRRQIYGVFGDRVGLLPLEDSNGKLVVNNYHNPNHTIGPPGPSLPPKEWEWALQNGSPARTQEALTWVGAVHRREAEPPPPNTCLEDADSVQRVAEVRRLPEVRKAIRLLADSEHPWINEAARAALQEIGERPPDGP